MMRKHAQAADDDGRTFCIRWIFTVKKAVIKVSEPISLRRMFYSMQESGQILLFVKQRGASPILLSQTAGKTKVQIAGINRRQGGAALPVRVVAVFLAASELHVIPPRGTVGALRL